MLSGWINYDIIFFLLLLELTVILSILPYLPISFLLNSNILKAKWLARGPLVSIERVRFMRILWKNFNSSLSERILIKSFPSYHAVN